MSLKNRLSRLKLKDLFKLIAEYIAGKLGRK